MQKGDINHLVEKHQKQGYNRAQLKNALIKAGFNQYKVNEGIKEQFFPGYKRKKHMLYILIFVDILYVIVLMSLFIWYLFNRKYF